MGWWSVRRGAVELDIGDQPLDAVDSALKKIAKSYMGAFKRKPTPEELTEILESSIRVLEEDLFDDMEERELDSVTIKLRQRPARPRPTPGDFFAIPLPSGGYGYGRIIKVTLRVLLWIRLLDARSADLLPVEDLQTRKAILDIETRAQKIESTEWPIVGNIPFSAKEKAALEKVPHWIRNYSPKSVEEIMEWKLARKRGLPPDMGTPYEGYRGS